MCYNGTEYYYRKNILGDVIAIYDVNGNRVCYYYYNAFGEHKVEGNTVIGDLNPFRYRGYYYDEELGFYYLQSRYYDPKVGRFISADDVSYLDPESIFGLNLYAYCNNDPVNYVDPSGRFVISIGAVITLGLVALFGITLGSVEATLHPIQNIADTLGYYISDAINSNIYSKDDISYSNNNIIEISPITNSNSNYNEFSLISFGVENIFTFKEHQKNKRGSNKGKHEKGQARRKKDQGGEKGDKNRPFRRHKRTHSTILFLYLYIY